MPFLPQLMEPVFVLIDSVRGLILLQDVVEAWSHNICDGLQQFLVILLAFVEVQLADVRLDCARVEYVDDAGVHDLVEDEGVVAAVVEDLEDIAVAQDVSQDLFGQLKSLHLAMHKHAMDVQQESVDAVVQLDHLDVAIFAQPSLDIYTKDLAIEDMRGASQKCIHIVDIQRLLGRELFSCLQRNQEIFLRVGLLILTNADSLGL